jgi:hypothetical protein
MKVLPYIQIYEKNWRLAYIYTHLTGDCRPKYGLGRSADICRPTQALWGMD